MHVIICWMNDAESLCSLAYSGGSGAIRVYEKDKYDHRLDLDRKDGSKLPLLTSAQTALAWMSAHTREQCQVPIEVGRKLFAGEDFAEVA